MCVISLMLLGIDFLAAFIELLTSCFMTWFAMTIIWGLAGFGASEGRMWVLGFMRIVWPDPANAKLNLDFSMSHIWAQNGANTATYGFGSGFYTTALSLKMASLTGASNRNTYLLSAVCWLISVPVLFVSAVWLQNMYGIRSFSWGNCDIKDMCEANPATQASRPPGSIYLTYGMAGFLITTFLAIMHARFIWFPFEPVGFIIATSYQGQWSNVWSTFLVAWIAKTIVLRTGGSTIYEKYAIPIISGFIAGVVVAVMIFTVTGMVRFYVPF